MERQTIFLDRNVDSPPNQRKANEKNLQRVLQTSRKFILKRVLKSQYLPIIENIKRKSNDHWFQCSIYITMLEENVGEYVSLKRKSLSIQAKKKSEWKIWGIYISKQSVNAIKKAGVEVEKYQWLLMDRANILNIQRDLCFLWRQTHELKKKKNGEGHRQSLIDSSLDPPRQAVGFILKEEPGLRQRRDFVDFVFQSAPSGDWRENRLCGGGEAGEDSATVQWDTRWDDGMNQGGKSGQKSLDFGGTAQGTCW